MIRPDLVRTALSFGLWRTGRSSLSGSGEDGSISGLPMSSSALSSPLTWAGTRAEGLTCFSVRGCLKSLLCETAADPTTGPDYAWLVFTLDPHSIAGLQLV